MCEHVSLPKGELTPGEKHNIVGNFHVKREEDGFYAYAEDIDDGFDRTLWVYIGGSTPEVFPKDHALKVIQRYCLDRAKYYLECAQAIQEAR